MWSGCSTSGDERKKDVILEIVTEEWDEGRSNYGRNLEIIGRERKKIIADAKLHDNKGTLIEEWNNKEEYCRNLRRVTAEKNIVILHCLICT